MYGLVKPILFQFDPEETHAWMKRNAHWIFPMVHQSPTVIPVNQRVRSTLVDQRNERNLPPFLFMNPIGLAAGFDKNGDLIDKIHHLGFGYAEVGSVTAQPYTGNPKPRVFRVPFSYALINRMGLPGLGVNDVCKTLEKKLPFAKVPIGVNIAATPGVEDPLKDILTTFKTIKHLPIAYVTINISCPNTEDSKKSVEWVKELTRELLVEDSDVKIPILFKLSPDNLPFALEVVLGTREIHGYVCGNTSATIEYKTNLATFPNLEKGGISGEPLRWISYQLTNMVHNAKFPDQVIISCGGISDGQDVLRYMEYADLVQVYTALIYHGPTVVTKMCESINFNPGLQPRIS